MKRKFLVIPLFLALLLYLTSCDYGFGFVDAIELVKQKYNAEEVYSVCHINAKKVYDKQSGKLLEKFYDPYFIVCTCQGQEKYYVVEDYNDHRSLEVEWIFDTPFLTIIEKLNSVIKNGIVKNEDWVYPYYTYVTADIDTIRTFYIENIDNYTLDENAPFMLQINDYVFIQQDGQMICFSLKYGEANIEIKL